MVRKEREGEAWPCVTVRYLDGVIITAVLRFEGLGGSLLSEHAVQEVP